MREGVRNRSWFALLRRDRLMFALAAAFLVLSQLLEPLAEAQAALSGPGETICSLGSPSASAPIGNHDPATDHCPQCVAGPCAGLALAPRDGVAEALALLPVREGGTPANRTAPLRADLAGEPPPAIRAPPASV